MNDVLFIYFYLFIYCIHYLQTKRYSNYPNYDTTICNQLLFDYDTPIYARENDRAAYTTYNTQDFSKLQKYSVLRITF